MMTIEDKQKVFLEEYSMFGWDIANTYKFLCLIGVIYNGARKKNPELTVYELLNKICPDPQNQYSNLYQVTQFHVMGYIYTTNEKFSTFGLKTSADIIAEVKRLLNEWLPF